VHEALLKNIKRRMTPQPVKIRADVELTCFAYDGLVKAAYLVITTIQISLLAGARGVAEEHQAPHDAAASQDPR
jgi:hypothetical protein